MSEIALELDSIGIEEEMKQSYLDYAMSVIVGRALPDVRDGLKPVHRRVLYAMRELGNNWNAPYKKSARIVGDVIGKYHPHGDTAVYDTMVRMAQPFSMRYMLVDGQGNFGSVDGDPPAAMRYTEVRMAKIAHEMLADLEKETVDFIPNYDESESEPAVLPAKIPALLVNGSSGIAVGMATNIPPHNLNEILDACIAIIDEPGIDVAGLMTHVPGPDFPTSAIINGARGIAEAYQTGRGRVYIRARAEIETNEATGQQSIVVNELPYQVNKARLLEKIAELVKEKKIEGISALRDESDKDGMRMVIVLRRGEVPEVVLNNLYQQTQMQTVFGINMVAIVDGQPRTLNLKEVLDAFIRHRREVVTRRSIFELRKARERAHILEGLATALANIDEVIELIKASPSPAEAREALLARGWRSEMILEMLGAAGAAASRPENLAAEFGLVDGQYHLSPVQAQAILDMRLHRLTGLEQDKILQEYRDVLDQIRDLLAILSDADNLMAVIRQELVDVKEEYGDARRTEILDAHLDLTLEDLICEEEMVVTLSHAGYAKTTQLDTYQAQRRGGKGKAATSMKDEDFVEHLFIANTHDTLLCFSSAGKVYWKKVYELPQGGRTARGKPIVNLLPLEEGERINAVLPIREFEADKFIFMATASGTVKKTPLVDYSRPRANGIIAVDLKEDDVLVDVALTDGASDVMLFSTNGKVIRFPETDVRSMGRVSRGVRGMRLTDGEKIISLIIARSEGAILTATEFGFGKRTHLDEYRVQGRGGQGIISIQTSARNGQVVGAVQVDDEDQIMMITNGGTLVRTPVKHVSLVGRNTQGVKLINLTKDERLVGVERVIEEEETDVDDLPDTDDLTEV
ncbi:DNA gyrase subunit A [Methylophaga frappieri]|uniref:DNA gyrase subunit A n=1 Tax=Methylophaga frappieri (strain ATCC BAA-2434 / DSM 25690 / JAM7) TaxID=754477 RepID=I1YEH0_METFJ|nr:DNA gyrase subunit A [Methylophaga frappieri]AFJ01313.1 DNA gyrase subunit A [Methylophaga frappieri]